MGYALVPKHIARLRSRAQTHHMQPARIAARTGAQRSQAEGDIKCDINAIATRIDQLDESGRFVAGGAYEQPAPYRFTGTGMPGIPSSHW